MGIAKDVSRKRKLRVKDLFQEYGEGKRYQGNYFVKTNGDESGRLEDGGWSVRVRGTADTIGYPGKTSRAVQRKDDAWIKSAVKSGLGV